MSDLTVHVGQFWDPALPNKLSIANYQPKGCGLRELRQFIPPWAIVQGFKQQVLTWDQYTESYWQHLNEVLPEGHTLSCKKRIVYVLSAAAKVMGVTQVTLCCWEKADNPHCHRKLIYDWLPEENRGQCR